VIVSCPACGTSFAVDDSLIGPSGRKVRCAKCAHRWHQTPTEQVAVAQPAPSAMMPSIEPSASTQMAAIAAAISERLAAAPEAGSAPPVPDLGRDMATPDIPSAVIRPRGTKPEDRNGVAVRRPGKRRGLLVLGIILGLLIAIPAAGYVWRGKIARSAPWAQDMYSLLSIRTDDPLEDLDLANIKIVKRTINEKPAVEITGDVFNKAQYAVEVPQLTATPLGPDGKPLPATYRFRLQQQILEPGETASFRVVYDGFPADLKGVNVAFDDHPSD
jgi:predicted Zn finger-like uncharacterized protein